MSRIIIVPGLDNSGPAHWQSWLEAQVPQARRISLANWGAPHLERWSEAVLAHLSGEEPALVVAHSFGCLASLCAARLHPGAVTGLLLVAPADPARLGLESRRLFSPVAARSVLVGSEDDPWMTLERAERLADAIGADFLNLGRAGHINTQSGYGAWPGALKLLEGLARPRVRSFHADRRAAVAR